MSSLLLTTKLHIPQIRMERVSRPRLMARLQQGLFQKLVLISAPAGYGKTSLVCEWLTICGQTSAWVSLDKSDNDPVQFWAYVLAAWQGAFPLGGQTLPNTLLNQNHPNSEALITVIINELDKLQQPIILVLDDYHNIDNQVIHDGLSFLLEHAPAHFHLVLVTRADPPLPLARLRAHSQMVELRLADLRFTQQESTEFLRTVMSLELSQTDLSLLETSTEGWIAGLQMAGLSLQGRPDAAAFIRSFSGEDRYILDFLFEEVFQRQPEEIQRFLLESSILDRLCASLCNAVTKRENSQTILGTLERDNLFLISLDEQRKWYRYHHLFSDLLRSHFKHFFPVEIAVSHQRASAWYEVEHDLENAIPHALAAQDFERAASLIEQVAKHLDMQNKQPLLAQWVKNLPRETLETHPWLCIYRAWGNYWTGSRGLEEEWLQMAESSIEISFNENLAEKRHIQGHIAAVRAHTALVSENISRAIEMGQKALDLLPEEDEKRFEATIALGAAYWAIGDAVRSEQAFGLYLTSASKVRYTSSAAGSIGYVGIQQVKQGRLQDAIATFQDGLRLATLSDGSETPIAGFPNIRLGDVWRERNDLTLAAQYLLRGVIQCIQFNQPDILTDAYICFGRYQLAVGDLEQTHENLLNADRVVRQTKVDPWVLCWLNDLRLRTWLAEDNLEATNLWAQTSGLVLDGPLNYQYDLHHQNLARVLVAQSVLANSKASHKKAETLLIRLSLAAEQAGWVHEKIKILILQAVNFQAHGMTETALPCLAQAVSRAEPGGYVRVFLDEGRIVHDLLNTLMNVLGNSHHIISDQLKINIRDEQLVYLKIYISKLLSAFENHPDQDRQPQAILTTESQKKIVINSQPTINNPLIEPLSMRELEVLRFLARGYTDKKIAEELVIARETVHKHLKNIYGKLGVHSRTEAIVHARELGVL